MSTAPLYPYFRSPAESAQTQTFRAPDVRAALAAVRSAMGDDAVIVETREVGGGLWGRSEIEVTAKIDGGTPGSTPAAPSARDELQAELAALRRVVDDLRDKRSKDPSAGSFLNEGPVPPPIEPQVSRLYAQLVRRGLEPRVAERLLREGMNDRDRDLRGAVRAIVGRLLVAAPPPWQSPARTVMALVGPTGVGKTTTIAKIAARALLESRRKVALITVDNYRIGAREHLGRYGELMHLPVHVAGDRNALVAALTKSADADLVLIDTAGRSDREAIAAQGSLLRAIPGVELHLVLSAASGARELAAAARRFRDPAPTRMIFTKLDESDGPAGVFATTEVMARPIACVADGQRVPDDLHAVTPSTLADLVVGPQRT